MLRSRRRRIQAVSYDGGIMVESGSEPVTFEAPDKSMMPDRRIEEETFSDEVELAMRSLSPEQRELILMADVDQVPYAEIAEKLGTPVGTIRSRLHRTHKALRSQLEKQRSESALRGNRVS
jgi:RNA polymerase sigma-70 factor (ECF subfamily)